ncbi:MAG TPA: magnesium transporter [Myxococcales bacterium]|nr:magnesium transporter [Myxococcales bacterium]HIL01124.1 magnesium transporter [Myxococcales bacterium]
MTDQDITTDFLKRLLANDGDLLAEERLAQIHPSTLTPLLADLAPDEIQRLIDLLFIRHRAAAMLAGLPAELMPQILEAIPDQRLAEVLARLEIDDMLLLVEHLPTERRDGVEELLPPRQRRDLMHAELYPPDSAGRAMVTHFIALQPKMTAQEAIDAIRLEGDSSDAEPHLYVVDESQRLLGVVPIRKLVSNPPQTPVGHLMISESISVSSEADQEEAAQLVARYDLLALPVTDPDDRMVGIITVDDVIDVINEEATEDIYRLAGLSDADRVYTSARVSISKRLPWMIVNLGTAFTAASVVGLYESTLDQLVSLAIFLPVVAGIGGNGGIQTLTVITRSIALGEIEFSSGFRAIGKELWVGLVIGSVAGILAGFVAFLWQGNAILGLVLLLSMMITMTMASLLGAAIPLLLKSFGQDPALGAGVLVTFCTDALGFFSFLGIATLLLQKLV